MALHSSVVLCASLVCPLFFLSLSQYVCVSVFECVYLTTPFSCRGGIAFGFLPFVSTHLRLISSPVCHQVIVSPLF